LNSICTDGVVADEEALDRLIRKFNQEEIMKKTKQYQAMLAASGRLDLTACIWCDKEKMSVEDWELYECLIYFGYVKVIDSCKYNVFMNYVTEINRHHRQKGPTRLLALFCKTSQSNPMAPD
jgi:hypothetical protein